MGRKRATGERRRQKAMKRAKRKEAGRIGGSHRSVAERKVARIAGVYRKAKAAMALDGSRPEAVRIGPNHYHVVVENVLGEKLRIGRARKPAGSRWWTVYDSYLVPDGARFARLQDAVNAMVMKTGDL